MLSKQTMITIRFKSNGVTVEQLVSLVMLAQDKCLSNLNTGSKTLLVKSKSRKSKSKCIKELQRNGKFWMTMLMIVIKSRRCKLQFKPQPQNNLSTGKKNTASQCSCHSTTRMLQPGVMSPWQKTLPTLIQSSFKLTENAQSNSSWTVTRNPKSSRSENESVNQCGLRSFFFKQTKEALKVYSI